MEPRTFDVPSESGDGTSYRVTVHPNGTVACTCPARQYNPGRLCKHAARVLRQKPRETFMLEFESKGEGPPLTVRIRRLLKAALRGYGLKCVGYGSRADRPVDGLSDSQLADLADDRARASVSQPG